MKKFIVLFIIIVTSKLVFSQITDSEVKLRTLPTDTIQGWKKGGVFNLNLSQTSLTNWASGGQNSFSLNTVFSIFANHKKNNTVWDNSFDIGYGLLKQGDATKFMKTDDKVDILSKYGKKAFSKFYYAALMNFKTQTTAGYNYPNDSVKISDFLAPAYWVSAIGIDYKPNAYISAFLAPLTGRITFVNIQRFADAGAFGVEPASFDQYGILIKHGQKTKREFGGYLRLIYSQNKFKNEILKNISFTSKIDLFSNYLKNPQNIDVNWETLIVLKVNKYISVSFNTHLIYDDDISISVDNNNDGIIDAYGPRIQFKELLGIGFSYKF